MTRRITKTRRPSRRVEESDLDVPGVDGCKSWAEAFKPRNRP